MRTVKTKVYSFSELSKDAQEKAVNDNRDWNVDYVDWYEFVIENWVEKLNEIGFENAEINFSHMYCQGQGASFTSDVDLEKIFSSLIYCEDDYSYIKCLPQLLNLSHKNMIEFSFWPKRLQSIYDHEKTCVIDHEIDLYFENCSCEGEDWFYNTLDDITEQIEDLRYALCQTIMSDLIKEHDYLTSDESIIDSLEANEIEFLKDGTIY